MIRKRQNIKAKNDKKLKLIDDLFRLNKDEFWAKIKKMQQKKRETNIEFKDIKKVYEDLFNTKNITNKSTESQALEKVDNFLNQNGNFISNTSIQPEMIKKLQNGKNIGFGGFGGVSNEMLKYCDTNILYSILSLIFEKMINYKTIPYLFNVSNKTNTKNS